MGKVIICACGCGREGRSMARGLIARCYMRLYRNAPGRIGRYPEGRAGRPRRTPLDWHGRQAAVPREALIQ